MLDLFKDNVIWKNIITQSAKNTYLVKLDEKINCLWDICDIAGPIALSNISINCSKLTDNWCGLFQLNDFRQVYVYSNVDINGIVDLQSAFSFISYDYKILTSYITFSNRKKLFLS